MKVVGSYWPFTTGKMVERANLLLDQIISSSSTRYVLIPIQHIGVYKVGYMPQWIAKENIARRGSAKFKQEHLKEAHCTLLGYCLDALKLANQILVGSKKFDTPDLDPLGRKIIDYFLRDASLNEYIDLIPMRYETFGLGRKHPISL